MFEFLANIHFKVSHLRMLSISNRYASGPSPCTWLSHAPWVVVTPPTTTTSLPPLDPLLPKPDFSAEKGQVGSAVAVWLLEWGWVDFRTRAPRWGACGLSSSRCLALELT